MANDIQAKILKGHPIGPGFNDFSESFNTICREKSLQCTPDALDQLDNDELRELGSTLLWLPILQITARLPEVDLDHLIHVPSKETSDVNRIKPLLKAAATDNPDDTDFWDQASRICRKNSVYDFRVDVDPIIKSELGPLYIGIHDFHEAFFGRVAGLEAASSHVFEMCKEGSNPLFGAEGWRGWPAAAQESDVLAFFSHIIPQLEAFAQTCGSTPTFERKLLAQPRTPIEGPTRKRSMGIGFIDYNYTTPYIAKTSSRYHWSHVIVPGELKRHEYYESKAKTDLARYVKEVFYAQDTRRFVLGFTLCGSSMRLWEFDRLGGTASEAFDINKEGLRFVSTILGFLWMNEEGLGFDPTFKNENGKRYIEVDQGDTKVRLIIDDVMHRAYCIAGRATTCWKAHPEGSPDSTLVIKDSWQYPDREQEGIMLRQTTDKNVVHMARHFHHETVQVRGMDDDVYNNVRGELDIASAETYWSAREIRPWYNANMSSASEGEYSSNSPSPFSKKRKRSSTQIDAFMPPRKRHMLFLTQPLGHLPPNRVRRRVILRDYGKHIYEASSRSALLAALEGCMKGHKSLYEAGFLHRDISINNLMINEETHNKSWSSFLIDLDFAVSTSYDGSSGAEGITGTKVFMAIGVLKGALHTFMHDLESFFWVLYWICIHYYNEEGKTECRVTEFERWNCLSITTLARVKSGVVSVTDDEFIREANSEFHKYWQPLVPYMNRLRKAVFPDRRWEGENPGLYKQMMDILEAARNDPNVSTEPEG
ncbi:serine/threonine-protein kinase Sgk2 [Xylaria cubensis]|nr:serine/threonine-protein kinase Sgk2 [Xylaria cubensis]